MTHYTCDRCGAAMAAPCSRLVSVTLPRQEGWHRAGVNQTPVNVGIEFQLPANDDELPDLCRRCQIVLAHDALQIADQDLKNSAAREAVSA